MVPTLKAEFKKLITVRSTYILVLVALLLAGLFTYFGTSTIVYDEVAESPSSERQSEMSQPPAPETRVTKVSRDLPKETLINHLQNNIPVVAIFIAIAVVLLMAHEFRYNTITYTLTTSNSRSRVLLSKFFVSVIFTILVTLLAIMAIVAMTYAAVHIKDLNLPSQDYDWLYILARLIGYALGFSLIGLAIITLVRNIIAGVVAVFLLPTIDAIAGELLKNWDLEASKLLPFSALNRVINFPADLDPNIKLTEGRPIVELLPATLLGAIAVFALYFVGVWIISWYLFLHRDAT